MKIKKGGYSVKKGGYSVKNGFYIKNDIKNDCKNNDEDGSIDEDGYILDPLTYDRISEGNLIQLSDGLCYNKSKNLSRVVKNRNSLPFGHAVTSLDKKNLSISIPSSPEVSIPYLEDEEFEITPIRRRRRPVQINIPPRPNVPGFTSEWHPATQSYILRREPTVINTANRGVTEEEQPEIIPAPRTRGRPPGSRNITSRVNRTPRPLIIESGSPDSIEAQLENTPPPRRGRPPGSRNRNRTSIMNAGRRTKKNKPKKH